MTTPIAAKRLDVRVLLILWVVALGLYAPTISQWSLSGDEFYTYEDSTFSIPKMLSFNSRPLYFIVCHYLLKWLPDWPVEFVIRVPAMLAVSLIPPSIYGILRPPRHQNIGLLAGVLALFNPWLFQMSQFGRYYGFVLLFATFATTAALQVIESRNRTFWIVVVFGSGLLSAVSHPPSILLIPAAVAGWILVGLAKQPAYTWNLLKRFGWLLILGGLIAAALAVYLLQGVLLQWSSAGRTEFAGGYDLKSILMSLGVGGGISTWCLALLPLLRLPIRWSSRDIFLTTFLVVGTVPLLCLAPFGGGVSSKYLLYCLPCVFILAGRHWQKVSHQLPTIGYQFALACVILGCNVPILLSGFADGDHYNYRKMARAIEESDIVDPIIYSSDHRLLDYYLDDRFQVVSDPQEDLGLFADGLPRKKIERAIDLAESQQRPLLLVSRQDRGILSVEDQAWLYARFAIIRTIEAARYDHRRHHLVLYRFRPNRD